MKALSSGFLVAGSKVLVTISITAWWYCDLMRQPSLVEISP
mgnify:CR=1 FL=1